MLDWNEVSINAENDETQAKNEIFSHDFRLNKLKLSFIIYYDLNVCFIMEKRLLEIIKIGFLFRYYLNFLF